LRFLEKYVPTKHAHSAIRSKDVEQELPKIIHEFSFHREEVRSVHSWLVSGNLKDALTPKEWLPS
jgi:hypothetical protein